MEVCGRQPCSQSCTAAVIGASRVASCRSLLQNNLQPIVQEQLRGDKHEAKVEGWLLRRVRSYRRKQAYIFSFVGQILCTQSTRLFAPFGATQSLPEVFNSLACR